MERIKLPPEAIARLKELEKVIPFLEAELRRAERAGIDVTELRKDFEKYKLMREGLLREYG